jgi:hypothetical protein
MLTEYEYSVLTKNSMISMLCKKQLESKEKRDDEVELSMALAELEDLIGHVAAESNHARSKRQAEDLGQICDYLESLAFDIKRTIRNGG